jgi:hypothetical protein
MRVFITLRNCEKILIFLIPFLLKRRILLSHKLRSNIWLLLTAWPGKDTGKITGGTCLNENCKTNSLYLEVNPLKQPQVFDSF